MVSHVLEVLAGGRGCRRRLVTHQCLPLGGCLTSLGPVPSSMKLLKSNTKACEKCRGTWSTGNRGVHGFPASENQVTGQIRRTGVLCQLGPAWMSAPIGAAASLPTPAHPATTSHLQNLPGLPPHHPTPTPSSRLLDLPSSYSSRVLRVGFPQPPHTSSRTRHDHDPFTDLF